MRKIINHNLVYFENVRELTWPPHNLSIREAWEQVEEEWKQVYGKPRFKSEESFRNAWSLWHKVNR